MAGSELASLDKIAKMFFFSVVNRFYNLTEHIWKWNCLNKCDLNLTFPHFTYNDFENLKLFILQSALLGLDPFISFVW